MIELVIAALLQIATITTDADTLNQSSVDAQPTSTEAATAPGTSTGGTGTWDDNG